MNKIYINMLLNKFLLGFIIIVSAIFQYSNAADKVIPCRGDACTNTELLRSLAIEKSQNGRNGFSKVHYFNLEDETSLTVRVFKNFEFETGSLIVRALQPIQTTSDILDALILIYNLERDIWNTLGSGVTIDIGAFGSNGNIYGYGYPGVAFGVGNWTVGELNGSVNISTSTWANQLTATVLDGLVNITGLSYNEVISRLNNAIGQQQTTSQQTGGLELQASVDAVVLESSVTAAIEEQQGSSFTTNSLPMNVNVELQDGLVQMVWNQSEGKFTITRIIDKEGNVIDVENGDFQIPKKIIISNLNFALWEIISIRFALTVLQSQLEGSDDLCNGCTVTVTRD